MIKKAFLVVGILFLTATVFAQEETKTAQERASKKTEHLSKDLSLNQKQKAEVEQIFVGYFTKHDEIKKNESYSDEQKKDLIKANNDEKEAQLKKTLTAEQYKKYEEHKIRKMEKKSEPIEMKRDIAPKEKSVE